MIDGLEIVSPTGCTTLEETHVDVHAGERILIVGESGTGKTLLFRALAGLWPWGAGEIKRAKNEEILYIPRAPYMPPGTLREVLAYPAGVGTYDKKTFEAALQRLDLLRLVPLLDRVQRWDRELSDDEQQCVAVARALLHEPSWILIDEVLDGLDEHARERVIDVFTKELLGAGIIHIGRAMPQDTLFGRTLHLIKDLDAHRLARQIAREKPPLVHRYRKFRKK